MSLDDMDVHLVIQCVGKCKEVVGVEEVFAVQVVDNERDLAFFGAFVHSRRGHNNFG